MIIVTNKATLKKGSGEKLIERFNKVGKVEYMDGFLGLEVLHTQNTKDYDEVTIFTRWRTKDDFKNWTKSTAFREAHSKRETPDYVLDNSISFYDVKVVREPRQVAASGSM
ncbi:heme oxygenase [Shouchella lonarensis]|uniref:Heme-degrading monooxygenase n=1 Tax=Shouchella lonarensis TaxID=1464122 RepID=A0A1G6MJ45_9BACI|nr:heme oxygenase [Shouchella lonarensis]SDC55006.1 heme oxygenase (staphylobilin-producing) [Shouchella lonarensis]